MFVAPHTQADEDFLRLKSILKFSKKKYYALLYSKEVSKFFVGHVPQKTNSEQMSPISIDGLFEEEEKKPKKRLRDLQSSGTSNLESDSKRSASTKFDDMTKLAEKQIQSSNDGIRVLSSPGPRRTKKNPFKLAEHNKCLAQIRKDFENGSLGKIPVCFHKDDDIILSDREVELVEYFYKE